jgi:hypothetical protein
MKVDTMGKHTALLEKLKGKEEFGRHRSEQRSKNYIKIGEGFDLNTDHSPIWLTISNKIITKCQNPVLSNKHADWEYFNYLLEIYKINEKNEWIFL